MISLITLIIYLFTYLLIYILACYIQPVRCILKHASI